MYVIIMHTIIIIMYNPVCEFVVLFADIHEKSMILVHMEITHDELHHPTSLCTMIAHSWRALTGVTNIEFSVLHVAALSNASMAHRR